MDLSPLGPPNKRRRSNSNEEIAEGKRTQLSNKIFEISHEFKLDLNESGIWKIYSVPRTDEEKCLSLIRLLFFKDPGRLEICLNRFRSAETGPTACEFAAALKVESDSLSMRVNIPSISGPELSLDHAYDLPPPEDDLKDENKTLMSVFSTPNSSLTLPDRTRSFSSTAASTSPNISAQTSFTSVSNPEEDLFLTRPGNRQEDAAEPKLWISKPLEHHKVKDLPAKGFFVKPLPASLLRAAENVRYECVRISQSYNVDIDELADLCTDHWKDYEILWRDAHKLISPGVKPTKLTKSAWEAATTESESPYLQRRIQFSFTKKSDSALFHLSLDPLQKLSETCRLFRHFGSHRFLKFEIPSKKDLPEYLKGQGSNFRSRLEEWIVGPAKELLGCQWKVFFIRPVDKEKKSKNKKESKHVEFEAFLFAERGPSLPDISVSDMLDWFLPFDRNRELSLHKAFARIELGLSKTRPTFVFKPSQVRWVPDMLADGTVSANDPWQQSYDLSNPCVMNDGCSRISIAAARKIWAPLKMPGPCPSAFQARIGPAKGMWMIDASQGYDNPDIWIEITPSQRKFLPHKEDLSDESYEPNRLTFEVLGWSSKATQSKLYRDFFPILEDRGVPRSVLQNYVVAALDKEEETVFEAFRSNVTLLKWIEDKFGSANGYNYEASSSGQYLDTLPTPYGLRVLRLLQSGFEKEFEYVSSLVKVLTKSYFKRFCADFDIPLFKSTFLYGVADPKSCLRPDEIHLAFSGQFGDEPYPFLKDVDALVARHPAMKCSDIQKVKVVYKQELCDYRDIVVFPTQGCLPLAGKLQGGDYDGDKFWVCFEKNIVDKFTNAAQPCSNTPESFGIHVDRSKLGEVGKMNDDGWEHFMRKGVKAKFQPQLLGMVSNFHQKLTYQNSISSKAAESVVDLHDFLVDSSKNGYSFDTSAWIAFKQKLGIDFRAVENQSPAFADVSLSSLFDRTSSLRTTNIIDHMIFDVARSRTLYILNAIDSLNVEHPKRNEILSEIYTIARDSGDPVVTKVLEELRRGLRSIYDKRQRKRAHDKDKMSSDESNEILNKATNEARESYKALQPNDLPTWWLHKATDGQLSYWDQVKATAIFTLHGDCMEFVFNCAGPVLCFIKATSKRWLAPVDPWILSQMKMRKIGTTARLADDEEVIASVQPDCNDTALTFVGGLDGSCDTEEEEIIDNVFDECLESVLQAMERNILESPKKRRLDGEEAMLQLIESNNLESPKKRRVGGHVHEESFSDASSEQSCV